MRSHSDGGSAGTGVPVRAQIPHVGRVPLGVSPRQRVCRQRGGRPAVSRREACGAFDALVHAVIGEGTNPTWTGLPPATVPDSLGHRFAQGVLHGRLPRSAKGACVGRASPLAAERIEHEGQRSVAELGAILWHAMDGPREAPELERWMAPPHADPVVALSISRRRLAEYAVPELVDRSTAYPPPRVWLMEIERAKGDTPAGIAVWRSRSADGEWRTRCACIWTHGRIGSATLPLVIGAQWGEDGSEAVGGACVVGPSWDDATRTAWLRATRCRPALGPLSSKGGRVADTAGERRPRVVLSVLRTQTSARARAGRRPRHGTQRPPPRGQSAHARSPAGPPALEAPNTRAAALEAAMDRCRALRARTRPQGGLHRADPARRAPERGGDAAETDTPPRTRRNTSPRRRRGR